MFHKYRKAACTSILLLLLLQWDQFGIRAQEQPTASGPDMLETTQFIQNMVIKEVTSSCYQSAYTDGSGAIHSSDCDNDGVSHSYWTINTLSFDLTAGSFEILETHDQKFGYTLYLKSMDPDAFSIKSDEYCEFERSVNTDVQTPMNCTQSPKWVLKYTVPGSICGGSCSNSEVWFPAESQEAAQRIKNAFIHAIGLAGGNKPQPF